MKSSARWLRRCAAVFPIVYLYQATGCLPDNAFREVLAENIVLTGSIAIQSIVSIILGNLFQFV